MSPSPSPSLSLSLSLSPSLSLSLSLSLSWTAKTALIKRVGFSFDLWWFSEQGDLFLKQQDWSRPWQACFGKFPRGGGFLYTCRWVRRKSVQQDGGSRSRTREGKWKITMDKHCIQPVFKRTNNHERYANMLEWRWGTFRTKSSSPVPLFVWRSSTRRTSPRGKQLWSKSSFIRGGIGNQTKKQKNKEGLAVRC